MFRINGNLDLPFDFRVVRALLSCRRYMWPFWQRQLTVPDKLRNLNPDIEGLWLTVREWPGQRSQFLQCFFYTKKRSALLILVYVFYRQIVDSRPGAVQNSFKVCKSNSDTHVRSLVFFCFQKEKRSFHMQCTKVNSVWWKRARLRVQASPNLSL